MGKLAESQTSIITDAVFLLQELMAADYPSPTSFAQSLLLQACVYGSLFPMIT